MRIPSWIRVLLKTTVLVSLALLATECLNAAFSFRTGSIPVDFAKAELCAPAVYKIRLTVPFDQRRIFASQIRLLDAGEDKFSYTPKLKSLNASGQGLFTIQNERSLLIAWPTTQMPLSAKGNGILRFPLLFSTWLVAGAFSLLGAGTIALFCCLPFPTVKIAILVNRAVATVARSLRVLGRHPFIPLSLPSAYLLLVYPPLWKDVDALSQLILPADVTNIYHFPALYCFTARLIVWLGGYSSSGRTFDLLGLQKPALQGVYTLVVVQQIALVISLGILCKTLTRHQARRGFFVLGYCFASSLYANELLCGSEAWSICASISLFAFGLRLYTVQGSKTINWIGYGVSLVLAIGSRYIDLLLGFWLIGLFLIASLPGLRNGQRTGSPSRLLLSAALAFILLIVAVFSNSLFQFYLAARAGVEPRSTAGRTISDRVATFLAQMKLDERTELAARLAATISDHNVRLAIQDQALLGSFYQATNAALEEQLRATGFSGEHLQAEKDRVILKAALIYLKTLHPTLLRVIWYDFLKGFSETSNRVFALEPFAENSYIGAYRLRGADQWTSLNVLPSTFLPESVALLDRSGTDYYFKDIKVKGLKQGHLSSMLFVTLLALGWCFWTRRAVRSRVLPAITILLAGTAVFAATMICVYFIPRYALPLWVSMLIAFSLAVDGLFETSEIENRSKRSTPVPPG